jgi:hypothetical protein
LKRGGGWSSARAVFLHSLDRPPKTFSCVRDIFDDPCVALRVQATLDEFRTTSVLADLAKQQVTMTPQRPRGNRRASELRRAETGLVKVRRLLSGVDGSGQRYGTRTGSNSAPSQPFKCKQRETVVEPNLSRPTTLSPVSVAGYAYPAEDVSSEDVMQDGNRGSRKGRFSARHSLRQVCNHSPAPQAGNYITSLRLLATPIVL